MAAKRKPAKKLKNPKALQHTRPLSSTQKWGPID